MTARERRLPVAPRPFRDETLSSWLGRVACRYGLDASALGAALDPRSALDPGNSTAPLPDDVAPAPEQLRSWASSCGVDPHRVGRLALSHRHPNRSAHWFASIRPDLDGSPPSHMRQAVCLGCLDADRVALRDGHLRADWCLAECCVCLRHGRVLVDQCPSCHRALIVRFRLREGRARLVCARCGAELDGRRGGEGDRDADKSFVFALAGVQEAVRSLVDDALVRHSLLDEALALLWAPLDAAGAARPVLALWCGERDWRCPMDLRGAVGRPAPLARLRVPWRALTLIAARELFGPDLAALERRPEAARRLLARAAPLGPRRQTPSRLRRPARPTSSRRADEYARMANGILAHPKWIASADQPERRRERLLGQLMDEALQRNGSAVR